MNSNNGVVIVSMNTNRIPNARVFNAGSNSWFITTLWGIVCFMIAALIFILIILNAAKNAASATPGTTSVTTSATTSPTTSPITSATTSVTTSATIVVTTSATTSATTVATTSATTVATTVATTTIVTTNGVTTIPTISATTTICSNNPTTTASTTVAPGSAVTLWYMSNPCAATNSYFLVSFYYYAKGASETLTFGVINGPAYTYIDDVSVLDITQSSTQLLCNGGFENGTCICWSGTCPISRNPCRTGNYCINNGYTYMTYMSQTFSTTIGHLLYFSFYTYWSGSGTPITTSVTMTP